MAKYEETSLIITDKAKAEVNAALEALGYGPDNFSVPVIVGTGKSVTHWGCNGRFSADQQDKLSKVFVKAKESYEPRKKDKDSDRPFDALLAAKGGKKEDTGTKPPVGGGKKA